jgi:hypothetical protein
MSGITTAACCCGDTIRYYALKCPDLMPECCPYNDCDNAPNRIDLCEAYLKFLGIPTPPDINKCYILSYKCCYYYLYSTDFGPCPNPTSPWPVNVGTLVAVFDRNGVSCCRPNPYDTTLMPPGTMANVIIPGCGPVVVNPDPVEFPCVELIADCYELCDQYGTVKGKSNKITSRLSMCVTVPGVPPNVRCDHGPPDTTVNVVVDCEAFVGYCEPCKFLNNVPVPNPGGGYDCLPQPFSCPNQVEQEFINLAECPDCWAFVAFDCCGGFDLCEDDPQACQNANVLNYLTSYKVTTCYSVQDCTLQGTEFQQEDLMRLWFDKCIPLSEGVDPTNAAALDTWVRTQFLTFTAGSYGTCWGTMGTYDVNVCGLTVKMLSGNAKRLAEKINNRIGASVQVELLNDPWPDLFWFGNRQGCEKCDWQPDGTRPSFVHGDDLEIASVQYLPATQQITILVRGVSKKKYCCVSQRLGVITNPIYTVAPNCLGDDFGNELQTTVCKITGTTESLLDCLSMPEYANGSRYDWIEVEQIRTRQEICVAPSGDPVLEIKCPDRVGWPLENVVVNQPPIPPYVAVYGWHTLCASMPDPAYECRCYPLLYVNAPCCPPDYPDCGVWEAAHPLPIPCVLNAFQSPSVYCETTARDLNVDPCG